MPLSRGAVLDVRITQIVRGECGRPGELRGYLRADKQGIEVACGDGRSLRILELQGEGGKRMNAASYLNGHPIRL